MPCLLDDLTSNLPLLRIARPDGLCCGDESLTFINNGERKIVTTLISLVADPHPALPFAV